MSTFSQRLARYKELSGLSRDEIGEKLGVTGRYVGMIERGEKTVEDDTAVSILLDFRLSELQRNCQRTLRPTSLALRQNLRRAHSPTLASLVR